MAVEITSKNIFDSDKDMIVCPVNCVGVMGKGLALQFKKLYPDMFEHYRQICKQDLLVPGRLWIWKSNGLTKDVLCFPTKYNWWLPSKMEYIEDGLKKFVNTYKSKNIKSIAFPLLGAGCGQLDNEEVIKIMEKWLSKCEDCNIEICIPNNKES